MTIGAQARTPPRTPWAPLAVCSALFLAADLATKHAAFRWLAPHPVVVRREDVLATPNLASLLPQPPDGTVTVIPSVLDLTLVLNPGAVFGIGAGRRWAFIIFTVIAVAFALWMYRSWSRHRDRLAPIAFGLLIGGGLGNLYDRLVYACVRDFLHPLPGVRWPFGWSAPWSGREIWPYVSNAADLWLLLGIGLLVVRLWSPRNAPRPVTRSEDQPTGTERPPPG